MLLPLSLSCLSSIRLLRCISQQHVCQLDNPDGRRGGCAIVHPCNGCNSQLDSIFFLQHLRIAREEPISTNHSSIVERVIDFRELKTILERCRVHVETYTLCLHHNTPKIQTKIVGHVCKGTDKLPELDDMLVNSFVV